MKTIMCLAITLSTALSMSNVFAQSDAPRGDASAGKQLFETKGCYSCHGFVGQGSREGPRLSPPTAYAAFVAQLRTPRLIMPPYVEEVVSDSQAADIYTYLANLPKPPDPKTIDLLK
jgi:ubiquinol-cytochrome c reductase cytochrome c subunit